LHIGQLTASAIRYARFGNLRVLNKVGVGNIFRPDDAGNGEFAYFEIDADFLFAGDHKITVRQDLGDNCGDGQFNVFAAINGPFAAA